MPKRITADELQPGMRVTRDGWLHASDRTPIVYDVLAVRRRTATGGWKAGAGRLWADDVRVDAEIGAGDDRRRIRFVAPVWETFELRR